MDLTRTRKLAGVELTRPGLEESHVADTIVQQMGGFGRLKAMLGAKVMKLADGMGIGVKWPNKERSRGNYVEIRLEPSDTYTMEFFNVSGSSKKSVKKYDDVYFDSLVDIFERQTGWFLSLGGSKKPVGSGHAASPELPPAGTKHESAWDNSAWEVVKPIVAYRRLGHVAQSNTYVGSSMMLPTVWQEVKLRKGDIVLGLYGGDFWIPRGAAKGVEVKLELSDKHPFEKTYGASNRPFSERWPLEKLRPLDELPSNQMDTSQKKFTAIPAGAKNVGRNIDVVLPLGAKLEAAESKLDELRALLGETSVWTLSGGAATKAWIMQNEDEIQQIIDDTYGRGGHGWGGADDLMKALKKHGWTGISSKGSFEVDAVSPGGKEVVRWEGRLPTEDEAYSGYDQMTWWPTLVREMRAGK